MKRILFIIDPLSSLIAYKDTTVFMMQHVKKENHQVFFCEPKDLYYSEGSVRVWFKEVMDPINSLEDVGLSKSSALLEFDYVFMRKDPPVNEQYMNALFILNQAAIDGCKVINDPASLMTFNEKMFALQFSDFMPNTLVTCNDEDFIEFGKNHQPFILKPLNGMGGESIYKFDQVTDEEIGIFQSLSKNNTHVMLQSFLPEIYDGDFRILIIHGEVCPIALARIPQEGSFKGNLAAGGKGIAKEISTQQKNVAKEIGKILIKNNVAFAGIDMIGNHLTEINVTSPTGAKEIFDQSGVNPIELLFKKLL
jgi:glutathione synthase